MGVELMKGATVAKLLEGNRAQGACAMGDDSMFAKYFMCYHKEEGKVTITYGKNGREYLSWKDENAPLNPDGFALSSLGDAAEVNNIKVVGQGKRLSKKDMADVCLTLGL